MKCRGGGSDGDRFHGCRISPQGFLIAGAFDAALAAGTPRYQRRRSMISTEQFAAVRQSPALSHRDLAADIGVSHETVRRVIRDADVIVA